MTILNLDDLTAGMVLQSDAKHHTGQVLLKAGVELTEKHLKIFHTWGLTEADVEGDDLSPGGKQSDLDPAALAKAEIHARERFQHTDLTQLAMAELFRLTVLHIAQQDVAGDSAEDQT